MTNKLISAIDVAVAILPKKDESSEIITLRKLQKILYYCQAWSLVWEDTPLFKEDIVACRCCGPMIAELQEYSISQFVRMPPTKNGVYEVLNTEMDLCFNGISSKPIDLTKSQDKIVMQVFQKYGSHHTTFLESFSKEEGPFKKAMRQSKEGDAAPVISLDSMKRYYSALEKVSEADVFKNRLNAYSSQFILEIPAWDN